MALEEPEIREQFKASAAEIETFERLLRDAHEDAWWRLLIRTIEERRQTFMQTLVESPIRGMTQREEDFLRGKINELAFFIALDKLAHRAKEQRNGQNGTSAS